MVVSISIPCGTIGFQDRDGGRPAYPSVIGPSGRSRTRASPWFEARRSSAELRREVD